MPLKAWEVCYKARLQFSQCNLHVLVHTCCLKNLVYLRCKFSGCALRISELAPEALAIICAEIIAKNLAIYVPRILVKSLPKFSDEYLIA